MPVFSPPFDIDAIGTLSNPSSFSFTKMGIHGHFSCLNRLISLQVIPQTIESHHPKDREPFFYWLVLWNMAFMTFHILGMSSSQLTNSYFLEGYGSTTNQFITWYHDFRRISMFGISFGGLHHWFVAKPIGGHFTERTTPRCTSQVRESCSWGMGIPYIQRIMTMVLVFFHRYKYNMI